MQTNKFKPSYVPALQGIKKKKIEVYIVAFSNTGLVHFHNDLGVSGLITQN